MHCLCGSIIFLMFTVMIYCGRSEHIIFTLDEASRSIESLTVDDEWKSLEDDSLPWTVYGYYRDSYDKIGWGVVEFTMNPAKDKEILAYMVGYAEGSMTKMRIDQQFRNTVGDFCQGNKNESKSCQKLDNFLQTNLDWMSTMIKNNPNDVYWNEVKLVLLQLQGIIDGHSGVVTFDPTIRIKSFGLLLLQLDGDLAEIETALGLGERLSHRVVGSGSCSGLIKLVQTKNGQKELFSSHDVWTQYNMMLRIMKRLNFPDHTEVFSGFPGPIFSGDDFYILSSGIVAMSTTNGNYNPDLWKYVTPYTVLEWIRTLVANRLAKDGHQWCTVFEKHNSGTYNNQWMIIDYNKFQSNESSKILHVLEQIPGQIVYSDVTDVLLNNSYWASYNIPYYKSIFDNSGVQDLVKKYGNWFTHEQNPRARMFARDHKKVFDIHSLIKLMRYNDFRHDPISRCNCTPPYSAVNSIAARCDLNDPDGDYPIPVLKQRNHGAIDVKATSAALMGNFGVIAECGPTHDQQPVFQWSTSPYANTPHEGHPDVFDFKPEFFLWNKSNVV